MATSADGDGVATRDFSNGYLAYEQGDREKNSYAHVFGRSELCCCNGALITLCSASHRAPCHEDLQPSADAVVSGYCRAGHDHRRSPRLRCTTCNLDVRMRRNLLTTCGKAGRILQVDRYEGDKVTDFVALISCLSFGKGGAAATPVAASLAFFEQKKRSRRSWPPFRVAR